MQHCRTFLQLYVELAKRNRLVNVLRDLSMQNDPGAPIDATPEQKSSIENRWEITEHKTALEKAKYSTLRETISRAEAALDQLRRSLYELLVKDAREKYFTEADRLRAEGKSTSHLRSSLSPKRGEHTLLDVGGLMRLLTGQPGFGNRKIGSEKFPLDDHDENRPQMAMEWLVHYAAKAWTLLTTALAPCRNPPEARNQSRPS